MLSENIVDLAAATCGIDHFDDPRVGRRWVIYGHDHRMEHTSPWLLCTIDRWLRDQCYAQGEEVCLAFARTVMRLRPKILQHGIQWVDQETSILCALVALDAMEEPIAATILGVPHPAVSRFDPELSSGEHKKAPD